MRNETILFIIAILAFLILAIIVAFRFKSVRNTFEGFGIKVSVEGEGEREGDDHKVADEPALSTAQKAGGSASIKIGGRAENSTLTARGGRTGKVDIGKDVIDSKVKASGGQSSNVNVTGNSKGSTIKADNPD
jgi:hypothetical protein